MRLGGVTNHLLQKKSLLFAFLNARCGHGRAPDSGCDGRIDEIPGQVNNTHMNFFDDK
ncbi:MAG: hypothetical protein ETSY1_18550 [Candidatus Entotheonella factor]|uniref:Uncharacterized protein n=1 Tax=Entotheonella factor TaxID=1429438 RepID=W4LKP7_ENTF1|nr:MAG: hypothetical protein ETSY1_18550 [Candidatus Entotheonella factor]